uniref:Macrophage mannose receptor 1-like isoform X1 n=1 Tax=Saccoglossus kowalevskii TaxID=10224 RepID=A0ABM0MV44_SACKO|nr:PREDICTED: macrophage mannose receptor 1-like isoform X1 [Saccoglossus kowalevskii]
MKCTIFTLILVSTISCLYSVHGHVLLNHVVVEYEIYTDAVTWDEAIQRCESENGQLARIPDKRTDDLLRDYIYYSGANNSVETGFWIGLNDRATENTFVWLNGGPVCYTNWAKDEPNNNTKRNAAEGQDCAQLRKSRDFKWDDEYCNDIRTKGYICEKQFATSVILVRTSTPITQPTYCDNPMTIGLH